MGATKVLGTFAERRESSNLSSPTKRKYRRWNITDEEIKEAVLGSISVAEVLRKIGRSQAGGTHSWITTRIKRAGISTAHMKGQGHNKGKIFPHKRRKIEDIFVLRENSYKRTTAVHLRRALLQSGILYKCEICNNKGIWNGKPLTLEVDHIDGNWRDDRKHNLRFICPNCHSQLKTTTKSKDLWSY